MSDMFHACSIENLNALSSWDVSKVTNMSDMFSYCRKLTDASGINEWNIRKNCSFSKMFESCPNHPEFTKITGTWDSNGTFTPND